MQWSQCVVGATGKILGPPQSVTVYAGDERATFWCLSTMLSVESLAWDFIPSSLGRKVNIAEGLALNNPDSTKYSVPQYKPRPGPLATKDKWYILDIHNVDYSDAGQYICREGIEITGEDKAKQDHAPSEDYDEYSDHQPADNDNEDPPYESRSANLTVLKLPRREGKHSHYDSVQVGQ